MPCACTVKGMLLKCVKSWLYSCSFNVHKTSWNPSVKLACGAWTSCSLSGTNVWHLCMPSLREVPLLSSVISQLKYWCKETVLFFLFIYRRWPHFFRTVCKEEICAEALTDLQCRPNFCSRVSAWGSFGFFKCAFFCFCSDLYLSLSLSTLSQPDSFSLLFIFCSFKDALFRTAAEIPALHYFLLDNLLIKIRTRV